MPLLIQFFKPSLKKVLFFLIIMAPFIAIVLESSGIWSLGPGFFLTYTYVHSVGWLFIKIVLFFNFLLCEKNGVCILGAATPIIVFLTPFIIGWFIACFLSGIWSNSFGIFGEEEANLFETMTFFILLSLLVLVEIMLFMIRSFS